MFRSQRFKLAREEVNLTLGNVYDSTRIDTEYMRRVESGRAIPSNEVIAALAKLYNVSAEWLSTGKGDMKGSV